MAAAGLSVRRRTFLTASLASIAGAACAQQDDHSFYVVDHYDPARDARADLAAAVTRASAEHKRILMIVGGDWCVWCHMLEDFIQGHERVRNAMAGSFLILKVNYSDENKNTAFLGAYPRSEGYPDFFVLDSNGALLAQQPTNVFEEGRGYNAQRLIAFAQRWRPGR